MTMFGCNRVPFPDENIAKNNLWLTTQQMNKLGAETIWHPSRTYRGPDARYLHFLLPIGGTGASSLIESTTADGPTAAEFTTRWEIIKSFTEKLDFQVLTSPSGDLLVEFPMCRVYSVSFHKPREKPTRRSQIEKGPSKYFYVRAPPKRGNPERRRRGFSHGAHGEWETLQVKVTSKTVTRHQGLLYIHLHWRLAMV
jgi:hypothetical protein